MAELLESDVDPDPMVQFDRWFSEAVAAGISQPEAMTLATASREGVPSARIVLMKHVDERGIVFFTDYRSLKGRELAANPHAALIFYWELLGRQVRIEGSAGTISAAESDAYFSSRPIENKLSALTSLQSQPVTREELDRRFDELRRHYEGKTIPRPSSWGGFRIVPERWEFWQRRFARLNDRLQYQRSGTRWTLQRLSP